MFIGRCDCCGQYTIHKFRVETGEKIWSDSHSGDAQDFDTWVFLRPDDYYGQGTLTVVVDAVGYPATERGGRLARYQDDGEVSRLTWYSVDLGGPNSVPFWERRSNSRRPYRRGLHRRDAEGYWFAYQSQVARWDGEFVMDGLLSLSAPSMIDFNGLETIDVIRGDGISETIRLSRVDDNLSVIQEGVSLAMEGELRAAFWGGQGTMFGAATRIEETSENLFVLALDVVELNASYVEIDRREAYVAGQNVELANGLEVIGDLPRQLRVTPVSATVYFVLSGGETERVEPWLPKARQYKVWVFDSRPLTTLRNPQDLNDDQSGTVHYAEVHHDSLYLGLIDDRQCRLQKWTGAEIDWTVNLGAGLGYVYNSILLRDGSLILVGEFNLWTLNDEGAREPVQQICRVSSEGELLWMTLANPQGQVPLVHLVSDATETFVYAVGPSPARGNREVDE